MQELLAERHFHSRKKFRYLWQLNAIKDAEINIKVHRRTATGLTGIPVTLALRASACNRGIARILASAILQLLAELFHHGLWIDVMQHHLFNQRPCTNHWIKRSSQHAQERRAHNHTDERITIDAILHVATIDIHVEVSAISDAVQTRCEFKNGDPTVRRHHQRKLRFNPKLDAILVNSDQLMQCQRIAAHQE